jgi:SagB-type dehydrogenase family enzyme
MKHTPVCICLVLATALHSQELKPVKLPAPKTKGGKSLMAALKARKSSRRFNPNELPLNVISSMLWAACGINRADSGKRTAPSARDNREIDVYVATAFGAYRYDAGNHMLQPILPGDIRAKTGTQEFVGRAPVNLIYVADYSRMENIDNGQRRFYAAAGAGFISQNVYLYCASEGLATVVRGSINRVQLAKALTLADTQEIMFAQSVGYPEK